MSQNKRGEKKRREREAEIDEGKGDFRAPFFSPPPPMRTVACLSSSLLVGFLLPSFSPLTTSRFPLAAALRRGVGNERYNGLSLSSCLSPTLSPSSPCTEHVLLPVLSLKWDALPLPFLFISFTPHERI